jgi:hypothetical protein
MWLCEWRVQVDRPQNGVASPRMESLSFEISAPGFLSYHDSDNTTDRCPGCPPVSKLTSDWKVLEFQFIDRARMSNVSPWSSNISKNVSGKYEDLDLR